MQESELPIHSLTSRDSASRSGFFVRCSRQTQMQGVPRGLCNRGRQTASRKIGATDERAKKYVNKGKNDKLEKQKAETADGQ